MDDIQAFATAHGYSKKVIEILTEQHNFLIKCIVHFFKTHNNVKEIADILFAKGVFNSDMSKQKAFAIHLESISAFPTKLQTKLLNILPLKVDENAFNALQAWNINDSQHFNHVLHLLETKKGSIDKGNYLVFLSFCHVAIIDEPYDQRIAFFEQILSKNGVSEAILQGLSTILQANKHLPLQCQRVISYVLTYPDSLSDFENNKPLLKILFSDPAIIDYKPTDIKVIIANLKNVEITFSRSTVSLLKLTTPNLTSKKVRKYLMLEGMTPRKVVRPQLRQSYIEQTCKDLPEDTKKNVITVTGLLYKHAILFKNKSYQLSKVPDDILLNIIHQTNHNTNEGKLIVIAAVAEVLFRVKGIYLKPLQIAGIVESVFRFDNHLLSLGTGVGKTYTFGMLSALKCIFSPKNASFEVVMTTNMDENSRRDFQVLKPLHDFLGIESYDVNDVIDKPSLFDGSNKKVVLYGVSHQQMLYPHHLVKENTCLIMDECDQALLDNQTDANISIEVTSTKNKTGENIFDVFAKKANKISDFDSFKSAANHFQLQFPDETQESITIKLIAYLSALELKEDTDYLLQEETYFDIEKQQLTTCRHAMIYNGETVSQKSLFSMHIHEALHAIIHHKNPTYQMRQVSTTYIYHTENQKSFCKKFKQVIGGSATTGSEAEKKLIQEHYGIQGFIQISPPQTSQPELCYGEKSGRSYDNAHIKKLKEVIKRHPKQPIILYVDNLAHLDVLKEKLTSCGKRILTLSAKTQHPEQVIVEAGKADTLTIATCFGARGVDFKPFEKDPTSLASQIVVIDTVVHDTPRKNEQTQGRTNRSGEGEIVYAGKNYCIYGEEKSKVDNKRKTLENKKTKEHILYLRKNDVIHAYQEKFENNIKKLKANLAKTKQSEEMKVLEEKLNIAEQTKKDFLTFVYFSWIASYDAESQVDDIIKKFQDACEAYSLKQDNVVIEEGKMEAVDKSEGGHSSIVIEYEAKTEPTNTQLIQTGEEETNIVPAEIKAYSLTEQTQHITKKISALSEHNKVLFDTLNVLFVGKLATTAAGDNVTPEKVLLKTLMQSLTEPSNRAGLSPERYITQATKVLSGSDDLSLIISTMKSYNILLAKQFNTAPISDNNFDVDSILILTQTLKRVEKRALEPAQKKLVRALYLTAVRLNKGVEISNNTDAPQTNLLEKLTKIRDDLQNRAGRLFKDEALYAKKIERLNSYIAEVKAINSEQTIEERQAAIFAIQLDVSQDEILKQNTTKKWVPSLFRSKDNPTIIKDIENLSLDNP
jgi:hypothetical protein